MNGAAGAAAAIAQAIKASGVLVRVTPEDFRAVIDKSRDPLVVCARGRFLSRSYKYLSSYKGLAFYTKSREPLVLPPGAEIINAGRIWTP